MNSSRAISTLGLIRTITSPMRTAPTFPAGPTNQRPESNGDGVALTTPETASSLP
jgi:hypothetical protein